MKHHCARCHAETEVIAQLGKQQSSPGWSDLQLSGRPFLGMLLCPACVSELREFLAPKILEPVDANPDVHGFEL